MDDSIWTIDDGYKHKGLIKQSCSCTVLATHACYMRFKWQYLHIYRVLVHVCVFVQYLKILKLEMYLITVIHV